MESLQMPLRNFRRVGRCAAGGLGLGLPAFMVQAVNDHVMVIKAEGIHEPLLVIPLSALPSEIAAEAATYTLHAEISGPARNALFLDDRTLCVISDDEPQKVTCIRATDNLFKAAYIAAHKELGDPYGYGTSERRQLLFHEGASKRIPFSLRKTRMRIDIHGRSINAFETQATSEGCCSLYFENSSEAIEAKFWKSGMFISHSRHLKDATYLDTGVALMYWRDYENVEDFEENPLHQRLIFTAYGTKLSIYDAAERSDVPCAEVECEKIISSHFSKLSMQISASGQGVLICQKDIYQFSLPSFVQPLEVIAAATAFNQLSEEKRDAINATGPYDFGYFVRECYS